MSAYKKIVSVHMDIVDFLWETESSIRLGSEATVKWLNDFRQGLAKRDPSISEYAGKLLMDAIDYREADRERKKKYRSSSSPNSSPNAIDASSEQEAQRSKKILDDFDEARKYYPGRKLGRDVEFAKLARRCKKEELHIVVASLIPAIEKEINYRKKRADSGQFVPEWKNFSTWINARAWEQDFSTDEIFVPKSNRQAKNSSYDAAQKMIDDILTNGVNDGNDNIN